MSDEKIDRKFGEEEEFGEGEESEELGGEEDESGQEEVVGRDYHVENDEKLGSTSAPTLPPIDLLSALPDSLILHILSFLSTWEAASTSFLSKRWRFLWTDLPMLSFWDFSRREIAELCKFVAFVHRTLASRSSNHLEKLSVGFWYDESFASDVNVWVEYAFKHKVKNVSLHLDSFEGEDLYMLPQLVYSSSSLTRLSLEKGCSMAPERTIQWGSLTTLELADMELPQHVMEKILSGCPVLYDLNLTGCWGLKCLEVDSQSLRALTIRYWRDTYGGSLLEISAPHIHSLTLSDDYEERKLRFANISSLVRAKIDMCEFADRAVINYIKELFEEFQHVKLLELGYSYTKALSGLVLEGWRLGQSRREHLIINAIADAHGTSVILELLESSPKLEMLVINWDYGPYQDNSHKSDLCSDLSHLKTVTITCKIDPHEPVLTVAQILLKRAVVLEKMVIDFRKLKLSKSRSASRCSIDDIARSVLDYARSSPKAVVLICK